MVQKSKLQIDPWIYLMPLIIGVSLFSCVLLSFQDDIVALMISLLFLIFPVYSTYLDCERIHKYIVLRGGNLLLIKWDPFGSGWLSKGGTPYKVEYTNHKGEHRTRYCKTGIFSDTYFIEEEL